VSTWLLATRNRGKLAELIPMLEQHGVTAMTLDDAGIVAHPDEDALERFGTFEENSRAKAEYFAARAGMPCLADDSGLCIDALDGAPGVRSRRFASDRNHVAAFGHDEDNANNDAMVDACWDSGRAPPWIARYVCAAALCDGVRTVVATGETAGVIMPDRDGSGGFGYDPFFVSDDLGMSFARASREAKAGVSHRARAFRALLAELGVRST
jgi:XTP/dITP diphosphohydrolase